MFFNVIATPGLGKKKDILQQEKCWYGQAKISINVNPLNGNLFVKDFTKSFTEQGFQFDVGYQYNSQSSVPWQLNQGKVIRPIQGQPNKVDSFVVIEESDGHESTYIYDVGRNCYVNCSETGGSSVLTYNSDDKWTGWNPANNTREFYNQNNQLAKLIDTSGNHLSYEYDSAGRLITIGGKTGAKVFIEYNDQTTKIYSFDGDKKTIVMTYLFDEKGLLKKTLIPVNNQEYYEINYGYSDSSDLLESITQGDETTVDFGYEHHRLTHLVNGVGNEFRLSYNDNSTQIIDPLGNTKLFAQNKSGLLQRYTYHEQYQEFLYDEMDRIRSIQYQDDSIQLFSYDELGFYSELTKRSEEKTLYHRDKLTGLLLCQTQILSLINGERQLNTFYTYNNKEELVFKVLPNGTVHAYDYDGHGNCNRETVYLNTFFDVSHLTKDSIMLQHTLENWCVQQNQADVALTEWTYNAYGEKISQTIYATIDKNGKGIHDAFTAYHEFEWTIHGDIRTQKTKLNEQETAIQSVEYDGLSRPIKEINALGQATLYSYPKNQQQTTFEPTGLVTTVTRNAGGFVTQKEEKSEGSVDISCYVYDRAGRHCIIEKAEYDKEYIVYDEYNRVLYRIDNMLIVTQNSYDTNNCLTHQWRYTVPLSHIDKHALKQGTWLPAPTGDYCLESTIYTVSGQVLCTINGDNFVTEHRYNSIGNRIETIEYATPLNLTPKQQATLNAMPEMIEESTQDRHHRYFYNDANQLIGEQVPLGQVIAYERNAQGELLKKITTLSPLPTLIYWDAALIAGAAQKIETFKLDARGQRLQHVNAEHSVSVQTWDAGGRIIESRCDDETKISVWDPLNRLIKESHSSGLERRKSYAPCGKIESDTLVDRIAGSPPRSSHIRYNGFGQITHELSPRVALKLSDPAFVEDLDLVSSLWQNESIHHTYNPVGLKISTQDELGNTSYFYYNIAQELCFTISPMGSITEYTYDAIFHQCESTRYYANCLEEESLALLTGGILTPKLITLFHNQQSEQDAVESVQFNKRGLITLIVDAEQFSTQKQYDAFNNLSVLQQQIDDDNELVSHMEYDKANRLISKIKDVDGISATETWHYIDEDGLVIYTDANHNIRKTYYDKTDRKIKEINGLGFEVTFAWDALSRLKQTTDASGNTTTLTYENYGRKITTIGALSHAIIEKNAFGEIEAEQNADGELWQKVYEVDGQVKTKIDPDGHQYTYGYNLAGWLIEVIDPLNKITRYQHTKSGHIERQIEVGLNEERVLLFKRDAQGREILRTDANGITTQTIYDKRGLETDKIIDPEALALNTHYKYDGLSNLIEEIKSARHYPNQRITQFMRDKSGRVSRKIVDPDDLQLITLMTYDFIGNCIATLDSNHHTSHFCYDAANNERYIIDPMGGVIGKFYNPNGRCIEERYYFTPLNINEINDFTFANIETLLSPTDEDKVFYYAYDADNNRIASLDESGKFTRYTYNAQGKKTHEVSYATPITKTEFMAVTPVASLKDRQSAWFYDGRGNEQFAINGEGIVTEQCWNAKGWLVEERVYATPYFDYAHRPSFEILAHQGYRAIHYIHDAFGRVVFEIDGEGYVTEYGYQHSDKPTTSWFYPDKIIAPHTFTITSIRELLPAKKNIPSTHVEYDAASRKVAAIDQLNYREEFKLDALDNLREYIDKGGDSWTFEVDAAGRKIAETTPPAEVTSVTKEGKLINPAGKQRIIKKIEYAGNIQRITEAYGTKEARTLELHQNPCNQTIKTMQQNVCVHDKSKIPVLILEDYSPDTDKQVNAFNQGNNTQLRPEIIKTLSTITLYNRFQKPIVVIDESGNLRFKVYAADKLRYEIDQEGFVTAYEYNVFANVIKLTRHAEAIDLDLMAFATTGIPLSTVVAAIKHSDHDRRIFFEFDNANRPIKTTQDTILVYIPQANGEAQYGKSAPVKMNQYTAFGEIHSHQELVNPFNRQWNVTRTWFNKSGYVIAQVDGLNYLTLFEPDRYGNNKKVIEYAKPLTLPLKESLSIEELLQGLEVDAEYDREYSNEMNARGEVVKTIQHNVRLYDAELDVSTISNPVLSTVKQTIEHAFVYNAKGLLIKEILPNGAHKITGYDARNLPVLKTEPARQLEAGKATPVITIAYNAFGQPTRLTHHKNPYENKAYLTASTEDQTQVTGFDARGLQIVAVDPEGAVHAQSFTETKKLASSWIWVSGWSENAKLIQRLHQTHYNYDKRGIEIRRCESIERGTEIITTTRSNAFGEKIAEGNGDGQYPLYWLHDKTGAVWNTNEQGGVPVITLCDARGQETLSLRSRTRSLKDVATLNTLQKIIGLDYRDLQRLELQRDVKGNIEAQLLPAFKTLKVNAPEPYFTAVSSGRLYPAFGKVSLSWPIPDIAGLESEIVIWPKGREKERKCLAIVKSKNRCGINVSMLPTDEYQYQIDFYYRDPQNGQRDGFPRYRAEGSAFILTDVFTPTKNLIWHQIDEQRLMLYGALGDVSGIELMQAGVSAGRVAISSTETPDRWMIDLSDKPSGRYEFHLLRGYSLLEDQPLKIGVPSPKGTRIDDITTHLSQATHLYANKLNAVVTSTWDKLPPQISNAYQELTVINAFTTGTKISQLVKYVTPQPHLINLKTEKPGSSRLNNYNTMPNGPFPYPLLFSFTISRNRLFTIDENNQQHTIMDGVNNNTHSSFLYVQPASGLSRADALREHFPDGHLGKTIALSKWVNQSSRCASSLANHNTGYDLISLQTTVPNPVPCGEITIHTANMRSKQLIVREIALTKPMVSKIKANFSGEQPNSDVYAMRHALNFKWTLPGFLANSPVKVNFQLRFNNTSYKWVYGDHCTFEYTVGKAFHTPYNGHLLSYPTGTNAAFSDFDLDYLNMYVQYNGDWIPLLHSKTFTVDRSVHKKPFSMTMPITYESETKTHTIISYNEGDVATFQDTYTLLFYPLPSGINKNTIQLEYSDISLPTPQWRPLADAQYTGHAIAAPANAINPGTYQFRIKAKNDKGVNIDFSALAEQLQNGWALGHFTVAHGGTLTTVHHTTPHQEVVRPVRKQTFDRWGNVVSSTNTLGDTTSTTYNGRNKPLRKTEPQIEITKTNGLKNLIAPKTHTVYDLSDHIIAVSDPNKHMTYHERDNDGKTLKTILADGVFKRFILDIFGRTRKIIDPFNHSTNYQYDRCNREVLQEDECHWKTHFNHNELGERLSVTKGPGAHGKIETERYDYLHPSRQVTHHYLPGGDLYKTIKTYDRHGIMLKEELPDHRQNTWETDEFGNIRSHTDLAGARYTYTLNPFYPTEVLQITSTNGQRHGDRISADGSTTKPMANQNLMYQYDEASHVVGILDNALPLTTLYRYDSEGRRARETFLASDGHIHQAVMMKWNALDWLEEVQDTVMLVKYTYDAKGNRRSTIASVYWNGAWRATGDENWYTYTASDSMIINRGQLKDGIIQITPNHGTRLLYDIGGRRSHELTINSNSKTVNKSLFYFDNNLLKRTESTTGDVADYLYDGQVARRKVLTTRTTRQESEYTANGWLSGESYRDDNQNITSSTSYALNLMGSPNSQTTTVRNKERTDGYDDTIVTTYVAFDTDKISKVNGTRQRLGGDKSQSTVKTYYDPNGNLEMVVGDNQESRNFITNSQSRIVKKTLGQDKEEYYFYTTSGEPLGRFGNIPPEAFQGKLTHVDFDLNYHPVSEHFPPPAPGTCLVLMGDSFSSISERMYGDSSFANLIADANGFRKEDTPTPGLMLQIPNIVNTNIHNWEGQYPIYNPTAIIGSLYPNMPMPQRVIVHTPPQKHSHRKFWHVLIEAIAGAVIMAFAPEFAGVFSSVFSEILGEALGFALAGAASSLVQQELAIQFGDQSKLSFNAIGQSALLSMGTAGIAKGLGTDLMKSPQYQSLIEAATKNIELTIATQGLSFATGQQRHFDWRIMLASITNTLANVGAKQIDFGGPLFNDAVATASASVASIGVDRIYDTHMNVEDMIANTLGTFIGNQLAAQAKQHYAEYQATKALEAEFHRSLIPEISEELEASKQAFIQSVLAHPNEHGAPPSSPQRSKPHAASMRKDKESHHQTKSHSVDKTPPQEHLLTERAREEALMSRSSRWNNEHNQTQSQQPRPSQHGFWAMVDKVANSQLVSSINEIGDNVAHSVMDMLNPVKQFKTAMADANESIQEYRSGHVFRGMVLTTETALDLLPFTPLAGSAVNGIRYGARGVSAAGSRLGLFGRDAVEETVSSGSLLRTHIEANIAASKAAREGSNFAPFSRQAEAFEFYSNSGYSAEDIFDHLRGIDFSRPVNKVKINMGDEAIQYMFPKQARIGNYFAEPGTAGHTLGIYTSGRSPVLFKANRDILALRSTTAPMIDNYSMARYSWHIETEGGATQYFTTAQDAWTRVKP